MLRHVGNRDIHKKQSTEEKVMMPSLCTSWICKLLQLSCFLLAKTSRVVMDSEGWTLLVSTLPEVARCWTWKQVYSCVLLSYMISKGAGNDLPVESSFPSNTNWQAGNNIYDILQLAIDDFCFFEVLVKNLESFQAKLFSLYLNQGITDVIYCHIWQSDYLNYLYQKLY